MICVCFQVCEKVSLLTYLSAHDSPMTGVDCGEGGGWRSSCGVGLKWLPLFSLLALFLSDCSAGAIWFQNLNGCKDVDGMAGVCCGPASCCGVESGDVGRDCVLLSESSSSDASAVCLPLLVVTMIVLPSKRFNSCRRLTTFRIIPKNHEFSSNSGNL